MSKPVRLAPQPGYLVGREQMLAGLYERLTVTGGSSEPRIVALCGLGGIGKTSVALGYAHRHQSAFSLVWQFPAGDQAAMSAGFADLAVELGARDLLGVGDPVAQVHGVLAKRQGGWLLIFDNALDAAAIGAVLPPAGDGQVIITTQSPHWPGRQAVEVPVLDAGTSAAFLTARTGDGDQGTASLLAGELGGLPLALEQAAAYMLAVGRDLVDYLELFRERRAEMLAKGEPSGYSGQVATTWSLAFDQVRQHSPQAVGLLRLFACCAADAIPYGLLLRRRPGLPAILPPGIGPVLGPMLDDRLVVDDAIMALRRYSLISAPAHGSVSIHRLVQVVTTSHLTYQQSKAWKQAAAILIEAALPGDAQQPTVWADYAALLQHVQVALPVSSEPTERVASYLGFSGKYSAARVLEQQVVDARRHELGAHHVATFNARNNLAEWTRLAGDPAGSIDQLAAVAADCERVFGAHHPNTLAAREAVAGRIGEAGDASAARDQYAALLADRVRLLGSDHPVTLATREGLALWTAIVDPAAGRDLWAALLADRVRLLGADDPATLKARAGLAFATERAGGPGAARDQLQALLADYVRVLGSEHPATLSIRASLAYSTGEGDSAAIRDQKAAIVTNREQDLGPQHPDSLKARRDLATWTGQAGDAAAARDQIRALLADYKRELGDDHPDTLATRDALARWTQQAGDAAAARDQYRALVADRERVLGRDHESTLITRGNLAGSINETGDSASARDQYAALLADCIRVLGAKCRRSCNSPVLRV